jgi:hypothetical protein
MASQDGKVMQLRDRSLDDRIGDFTLEVHRDSDGGSLVLTPPQGAPLVLTIRGDHLEMAYGGPKVRFVASDAAMEFEAKSVAIRAEDTVAIHAGRELDLHSGEDVEVRADHQVNLWAHGVLVGD